jgi:hypothetical protein
MIQYLDLLRHVLENRPARLTLRRFWREITA